VTGRNPLTVLQLTPNLEVGGAQETVRMLAKYLPRAGCGTVVGTFADGPLRSEIAELGVRVEVLPERRHSIVAPGRFAAEAVRLRRALVRLLWAHHVDVVLTKGLGTLDFLVMTLRLGTGSHVSRPQVWWTIENSVFMVREEHLDGHAWLLRPKQVAHRLLYRAGARLVNGVIAVSDETARSFREQVGTTSDRVVVVCNAVDTERYPASIDRDSVRARLGFGPRDHVMTMVGTFKRQKGHTYLVDAAAAVAGRLPHLHILLVGDGELAGTIRAQVAAHGLDGRAHLLATRRDVPELLAASDSFVLPSLWEGLPVALVEAMASRLPVIATDVSGTNQVMEAGVTGWIVPPADVDALAKAITELVSDPARAAAMADAAAARAAAFSAQAQAERLTSLFRRGGPATQRRSRHWATVAWWAA
jgi:glycosyltransferase involved in cell wall biosynthesis